VHALGDRFNYPTDGGMGLLTEVTQEVIGVPIHYWARIDFDAFVEGVNAVEGLDIYVEQAFTDYNYPRSGYEDAPWEQRYLVVNFPEGWQHMDGETALQYARSRHALGPEGSDFARAKRQQNVINAFVTKVMSSETLFNLEKLRGLYNAVSDNVATDIGVGDLPLFYQLAKKIEQASIEGHVLGGPENDPPLIYAPDPGLFGGAYVLIPTAGQNNYSQIQEWAHAIFYQSAQLQPTE
jgi:LCP family protein required for cell wall assembly